MIDALVAGKLHGLAEARQSKQGKPFVTAKVRAAAGNGESLFVNVIAFDGATCDALLALGDGDAVALTGALTPKAWADRAGNVRPALDLLAHGLMTPYHINRKRRVMNTGQDTAPASGQDGDGWQNMGEPWEA